jgi:hypothetical protein
MDARTLPPHLRAEASGAIADRLTAARRGDASASNGKKPR